MKPARLLPLMILLAACNKAPSDVIPPDPGLPSVPAAAPATDVPTPTSTIAQEEARIEVTPVRTDNCHTSGYTAQVNWDTPPGISSPNLEVRVNRIDGGLLAFKKTYKSSAKTGNWVKPGTEFFLVDRDTGKIVAHTVAGEYDCQ